MSVSVLPDVSQRLSAAAERLRAGRPAEAHAVILPVVQADPKLADARHLLGLALDGMGDREGAERELRAAIGLDKRRAPYHAAFGDVLAATGRAKEAERAYRNALTLDRRYAPAAEALSGLLVAQGRAAEALQVTAPLVAAPNPTHASLAAHATALKALGRREEALTFSERALSLYPQSAVAEHNVAATLGDLARNPEAEAAARRAFAKGLDAPQTWLVYARAVEGQDRYGEAERALREALRRAPDFADAHRELAQLIWMRTEDLGAATRELAAAVKAYPNQPALSVQKAKVEFYAGDLAAAYATLLDALSRAPGDLDLQLAAATTALRNGDPQAALRHAEAALSAHPRDPRVLLIGCEANLGAGEPRRASELAEKLRRLRPNDQHAIAMQATAWRLLGDPRYGELYDYAEFVRPRKLDTPNGWGDLGAYLGDLALALKALHRLRTHPLDQSLRHGTQTAQNLLRSEDPAIKALFQALDGPIRAYLAGLGRGKDPLRSRNTGDYRYAGIWSVRLRPNAGHHANHVHQEGWVSSACYIELPSVIEGPGHEGWIKFGEPGMPTKPPLAPEHFVKPEPGLLVLFPSYMWHGTVPFSGEESRLTVAFDLLPAGRP